MRQACGFLLLALFFSPFFGELNAAEEITLFNGKDLTNWEGDKNLWSVENGVIVGETRPDKKAKANTFLYWRGGQFQNGELRFSCRLINTKNNSGVMYRGKELPDFSASGYQCDIQAGPANMAKLYDEKARGRVCMAGEKVVWDKLEDGTYGKKEVGAIDADGAWKNAEHKEWNNIRIVAQGNNVQHYVNGIKVLDFTDNEEEKRSVKGHIALQIHAGVPMRVEFKDIALIPAP
jgi:Domain of Unknown Function (DUF1080)